MTTSTFLNQRTQTLLEEIVNGFSHFIGLGLSIAGLVVLLVLAEDVWKIVGVAIYGSTLILLYLISTLYHSFPHPKFSRTKNVLRRLDHSAIYLLIAGTYTPFLLTILRGGWGWSLFGVIWGIAFVGIIFKSIWIDKLQIISTIFYLIMGWIILIAFDPLIENINNISLLFLILGGATYTGGVFFFFKNNIRYFHNIWHLFVLAGSILHFFSVLFL